MRIEGILFEPVGCLAEFPAEPFLEAAVHLFGGRKRASKSGSRSYWHLLNLMEGAEVRVESGCEALELEAVGSASLYEDVAPALAELQALDVELGLASSLSQVAVTRFLEAHGLAEIFSIVSSRDSAEGIKMAPLAHAIQVSGLAPEHTLFLADTAEGIKTAQGIGINAILMMNDPDEAKRLVSYEPAGGIVSLHELPDFVRFARSH
jgi:phosphoglycolate phosphatase-like HAD superfamily hydrolase